MNLAVAEMDKVTQHNAASAEESSSMAAALSGQSQGLASMVGGFMLHRRSQEPRGASAPPTGDHFRESGARQAEA